MAFVTTNVLSDWLVTITKALSQHLLEDGANKPMGLINQIKLTAAKLVSKELSSHSLLEKDPVILNEAILLLR